MTDRPVLAVLPLGATEQHGPHLPVETDTLLAAAAARSLAGGRAAAAVLPPMPYGASGEHQAFPGTVSIGTDGLVTALIELGRSVATWADGLVVVNGHGGNVEALRRAVPRLRYEGRDVVWLACRTAERPDDTHAGHAETSLMLHLHPDRVRMRAAEPGCTRPLPDILPELRDGGVSAVSPSGVLGDPSTATEGEGRRLWNALLADAHDRLERWAPVAGDGMLR